MKEFLDHIKEQEINMSDAQLDNIAKVEIKDGFVVASSNHGKVKVSKNTIISFFSSVEKTEQGIDDEGDVIPESTARNYCKMKILIDEICSLIVRYDNDYPVRKWIAMVGAKNGQGIEHGFVLKKNAEKFINLISKEICGFGDFPQDKDW